MASVDGAGRSSLSYHRGDARYELDILRASTSVGRLGATLSAFPVATSRSVVAAGGPVGPPGHAIRLPTGRR